MSTPATASPGRDRRPLLAVVGTVLPALLVGWLLVLHLRDVPAMRKTADVYGMTLSERTKSVVWQSMWLADNWWWTVPCLVPLGVANIMLIRRLGRGGRLVPPIVWITAVFIVLIVTAVRTRSAIEEPLDFIRDRGLPLVPPLPPDSPWHPR
ncbi:MAG: hypothetical protein C0501_06165 [Isosphaera sp.]|nr:hypothetical protein [Isosphaera sp.]